MRSARWRLLAAAGVAGLLGCGGGSSSPAPSSPAVKPDWPTVKRVAQATPPMSECPKTKDARQGNPPDAKDLPKLDAGSMALECEEPAFPTVRYLLYTTVAERDKAIADAQLERGNSPFFVNDRLLVNVIGDTGRKASPLARRIKQECTCGEIRAADDGLP
jgi:hypothetical protein